MHKAEASGKDGYLAHKKEETGRTKVSSMYGYVHKTLKST